MARWPGVAWAHPAQRRRGDGRFRSRAHRRPIGPCPRSSDRRSWLGSRRRSMAFSIGRRSWTFSAHRCATPSSTPRRVSRSVGDVDGCRPAHHAARRQRGVVPVSPAVQSVLLDEASRFEPNTVRERHLRAARWWAAAGSVEQTIEHARAGGDLTIAADLVVQEISRAYNDGG